MLKYVCIFVVRGGVKDEQKLLKPSDNKRFKSQKERENPQKIPKANSNGKTNKIAKNGSWIRV